MSEETLQHNSVEYIKTLEVEFNCKKGAMVFFEPYCFNLDMPYGSLFSLFEYKPMSNYPTLTCSGSDEFIVFLDGEQSLLKIDDEIIGIIPDKIPENAYYK